MEDNKGIKEWWLHLDGELSEEEQSTFLRKLEKDPELSATFAEAQLLEAHLQEVQADEPSMRFQADLLEQLPALYKSIPVEPVFGRKSIFRGSLLLLSSVLISLSAALSGQGANGGSGYPQWKVYLDEFLALPSSLLMVAALTSFCMVGVFVIDQLLKKRFLSRRA